MKRLLFHPGFKTIIPSPFGNLALTFSNQQLCHISLSSEDNTPSNEAYTQQATSELQRYFENPQHTPQINHLLEGTPFQLNVWQALLRIPSGNTLTYGALAKQLKTSPRAIGQACRTNPLPIIIPCHRIVGAKDMGGYAGKREGALMDMKRWLLNHEHSAS